MAYILFKIPNNVDLLYDRESNLIVNVSDIDASALAGRLGEAAKEECLKRFQEHGLCQPSRLNEIEHPETLYISQYCARRVGEVILQVTQNCNLRCEYCVYSGSYYNRTHTAKRMSFETACHAVDFLMQHSLDRDSVHIGFYGGEPLLEMDLIKKVVDYVESEYVGKKVTYGLTTNATLLDERKAEYLERKNFSVLVSLDGPKEYQDLHRKFVDGTGSFDIVMRNLENLKQNHPDFFSRIRTNSVLSPNQNYKKVLDFFSTNELLNKTESRISEISDIGSKEDIEYGESYEATKIFEESKIILYALGYIEKPSISKPFLGFLADLEYLYKLLKTNGQLGEKAHPGGPCTPGIRRLFIDVEGRFFPCERVGESENMQFGDLENGFDEEKIKQLLNIGIITRDQCMSCWAFSFCEQCVGLSIDGGKVSAKKRLSRCHAIRNSVAVKMRNMMFLIDNGFDFERIKEFQRKRGV